MLAERPVLGAALRERRAVQGVLPPELEEAGEPARFQSPVRQSRLDGAAGLGLMPAVVEAAPGLERDESRALLKSLIDFVVSDERRVYSHNWTPGDTLFWDNRFVLHRARPYDYSKPRYLIGTRVAGDPDSELAYYPDDPGAEAGRKALAAELQILREEARDRRYGATTATH